MYFVIGMGHNHYFYRVEIKVLDEYLENRNPAFR